MFAQRFDATGGTLGPNFAINTTTTGNQDQVSLAGLNDGNFVAIWRSFGQDGDAEGVIGQIFDSAGTKIGGEFQVNSFTTGEQTTGVDAAVAATDDGGFVVTWQSAGQDGDGFGVFAQRFDAKAQPLGPAVLTAAPATTPSISAPIRSASPSTSTAAPPTP